ncbi:MAG TPA: sigma-70 family RNA polymerase sigma factor [Puia sp.]|nr:sigma-70 family RNA polymerase sigma factor [Puia sp.]
MENVLTIEPEMNSPSRKNISTVIGQFGKRLFGFIRQRVSNEADAEDILQDVWYQLSATTEPIQQVSSWLFTVARNKITDSYRKKKPELLVDLLPDEEAEGLTGLRNILFDNSTNPETEHLHNLFWETLEEALRELPKEQRDVFVMNELEEIPFKDIAEITGTSVNTLLSRKRYAVLHLRERLTDLRDELLNY